MPKHELQRYNNFGLVPAPGHKFCPRCNATWPLLAFYKCDYDVEPALCKKHKRAARFAQVDIPTVTGSTNEKD